MKLSLIIISILLSLGITADQVSQYIWLEYGQLSLTKQNDYVIAKVPCKSRINQCSYQYTNLPLGWTALPNGNLQIPLQNVRSIRSYSIGVTLSEPTGEKLVLDLIADMDGGTMAIYKRQDFFSNYNYKPNFQSLLNTRSKGINPPPKTTIPPTLPETANKQNVAISNNVQNTVAGNGGGEFLPLSKVSQILSSGDITKIRKAIQNIIGVKTNCNQKIKYIEEVIALAKIQVIRNEGQVQLVHNQISALQFQLVKLQSQRNQLKQQQINQERTQLIKNIKQKISKAKLQHQSLDRISQNYLLGIQKGSSSTKIQNNRTNILANSYEQQQKQIEAINSAIKQLIARKQQLQNQISQKKLKITLQNLDQLPLNIESLESKYREYSQLAVKAKVKLQNLQYDLSILTNKQNQSVKELQVLNSTIKKKENEVNAKNITPDGRNVKNVRSANDQIDDGINSLERVLGGIEDNCPAY